MKNEEKYTKFALVREMMETPSIIKNFKLSGADNVIDQIKKTKKVFLTGEGSSRIFPAKNAMTKVMKAGQDINVSTDGSFQAVDYDLSDFVVFCASNSGQTKEVICLANAIKKKGHDKVYGLIANKDTKLEEMADQSFILSCGKETAVAATKSVAEQGLFYQALLAQVAGKSIDGNLAATADAVEAALTIDIDPAIIDAICKAGTIYFAGRNDGVAEELRLKTNEITRKKSDYLEGTYLLHGVEEVMKAGDVVILIDPYKSELELIKKLLADQAETKVFVIDTEDTIFPTIKVKDAGEFTTYAYLAAGWNILVEVGMSFGLNLDEAERARKVGNAYEED